MRYTSSYLAAIAAAASVSATSVKDAKSLKDIKHLVFFMQENRGFDHVSVALPGCVWSVVNASTSSFTVLWHNGRCARFR